MDLRFQIIFMDFIYVVFCSSILSLLLYAIGLFILSYNL